MPSNNKGSSPHDLEELLRRGQDKLRNVLPGGNLGGRGMVVLFAIVFYGATGIFQVAPDELGLIMRFGRQIPD
jgi:membrane protease subunit HflK